MRESRDEQTLGDKGESTVRNTRVQAPASVRYGDDTSG